MKKYNSQYLLSQETLLLTSVLKKITVLSILSMSLVLVSCGNDKKIDQEGAARHVTSATTYQGQGQFHAAILEAKNAITKNPDNPAGHIILAKIYNQVGSFEASQKLLESVYQKMPSVGLELAESYIHNNKFRSAINALNTYVPDEVTSPGSTVRKQAILAQSYIRLGDKPAYESAVAALKKMPDAQSDVILLEAEYLMSQGLKEDTVTKLDQLATQPNLTAKTYLLLGNFALQNNQPAKAEDFYTKAISQLPNTDVMTVDRRVALTQLTETLILQGRTSEAYRYQKILSDANPEGKVAQQKFTDAMELYRQGKFAEAEKLLEEIRDQFPQDKNSAMLLGLVQFQRGQDDQAIELFDKYIDTETASSTLIQTAAIAKFRAKKMDEALAMLKNAVAAQPNNADILATYGLALLDLEPTSDEGQKAIEKSLAINPEKHRLRLALAKRHYAMKNPEQGLAQLRTAHRAVPLDFVVHEAFLKALMQAGMNDEVKKEIASFQKEHPTNPRGAFIDGWHKLVIKDYAGAQVSFEKALAAKDNTEKVLAYTGLAELHQLQNQPQKAINVWQTLLTEDPTQIPVYAKWYQLSRELKRIQEALAFLTQLESKSEKWQPSAVLAQVLQDQKQMPEAIKHIEKALERSANSPQVKQLAANIYQSYGGLLQSQNKAAEAKTYFLKTLHFYPENSMYLGSLIHLELAQKNILEAQKLLDQFTQTQENENARMFFQGMIRFAENKNDEGLELYRKSWASAPSEIVAEALLQYYQKNNMQKEVESFLTDWGKKLPKSYRAALLQAVSAQNSKKTDQAITWYEKAVEISPNAVIALNNLAWLYYEKKDPRAEALAKRAAQLAPSSAEVLDTYGWILVETGKVKEGIAVLQTAASISPDNTEIKTHLEDAQKR
jgi:tetratricopeptide (TPR) repeat protein